MIHERQMPAVASIVQCLLILGFVVINCILPSKSINMNTTVRKIIAYLFVAMMSLSSLFSQVCVPDTNGFAAYLSTLTLNENAPLTFEVPNQASPFAVLHGSIETGTPQTIDNFIAAFPNVTTLVFMQIPGSGDDDANFVAGQKLRNRGYLHYLPRVDAYPDDAFIASGGVDLFIAGVSRVIDMGAEVGVHAWSDGMNEATDFPMNDPVHQPYINYYVSMGMTQQEAQDFYFFTIMSAPAAGIHHMLEAEIVQYKLRLCNNGGNQACTDTDFVSIADLNVNTTIRAQNTISLSHSVLANATVLFYAGNEVTLHSGAEVNTTGELVINIENCTN